MSFFHICKKVYPDTFNLNGMYFHDYIYNKNNRIT